MAATSNVSGSGSPVQTGLLELAQSTAWETPGVQSGDWHGWMTNAQAHGWVYPFTPFLQLVELWLWDVFRGATQPSSMDSVPFSDEYGFRVADVLSAGPFREAWLTFDRISSQFAARGWCFNLVDIAPPGLSSSPLAPIRWIARV